MGQNTSLRFKLSTFSFRVRQIIQSQTGRFLPELIPWGFMIFIRTDSLVFDAISRNFWQIYSPTFIQPTQLWTNSNWSPYSIYWGRFFSVRCPSLQISCLLYSLFSLNLTKNWIHNYYAFYFTNQRFYKQGISFHIKLLHFNISYLWNINLFIIIYL